MHLSSSRQLGFGFLNASLLTGEPPQTHTHTHTHTHIHVVTSQLSVATISKLDPLLEHERNARPRVFSLALHLDCMLQALLWRWGGFGLCFVQLSASAC